MKKILFVAALVMIAVTVWARPALRGAVKCMQPDGTSVTLQLNGDEYYHFSTTVDGYTVLQNAQGVYEYARLSGDRLVSTGIQAHDAADRSQAELALLATLDKRLVDRADINRSKVRRAERDNGPARAFDLSKFRGLVILINFKDRKFSRSDAKNFFTRMLGEKNYTGYTNEDGSANYYGNFDGSVRDYFFAQSMGKFDPVFDVYGPVEVNYNATQCQANSRTIFQSVLKSLDGEINYANYDGDNDGVVDNVCFIVAGWGSHVQGNNSGLLWPHESRSLLSSKLDGKSFNLYSCSTEMLSAEGVNVLEGIGTFCHEFSHVLGLKDHYDTDYSGSGGQSHTPGEWDVMAGGADHNNGRTPVGYSIFERYSQGWANPVVINEAGSYTLEDVSQSNAGFIIKTPRSNEYFMLDNRQKKGWDRYLPGHGMIVTRVDSTSAYYWVQNQVNANPSHNYLELLRAGNTVTGDLASDPFPGTMGITRINNNTSPNLKTWNKLENNWQILNIRETGGVITFDVLAKNAPIKALVETFESMSVMSTTPVKNEEGEFANWDFAKCYVKQPGADLCVGTKSVEMVYPSQFSSATPIYYNVTEVSFEVFNPTTSVQKFGLSYSVDDGKTWVKAKNAVGSDAISIPASTNSMCNWLVPVTNKQPVRFRVALNGGHAKNASYVDNFTVYYTGEAGTGERVPGDVTGDGKVDVADVNGAINMMLGKLPKTEAGDVSGDGKVDVADVNSIINIMLGK